MLNQTELIKNRNWDIIILLDGCRYDYLEEEYEDFLDGNIRKVKSPSFETSSWLWKTFDEKKYEDIVYISANPYVNTSGVESERFDARNKFHKIVNAREKGWNENLETVPPGDMGKITRITRAKFPDKKIISHFMQPHFPFLDIGPLKGLRNPDEDSKIEESKSLLDRIFKKITVWNQRKFGARGWYLQFGFAKKVLGKEPHVVEQIAQEYGKEKLREFYRNNIRRALEEVKKIVKRVPDRKVIVTSDHGYLLGEDNEYAHMSWSNTSLLYEVPWLVIEN